MKNLSFILILSLIGFSLLQSCKNEKAEWQKIQSSNNVDDYKKFIQSFKNGEFSTQAQEKLILLENKEMLEEIYDLTAIEINGEVVQLLKEGGFDKNGNKLFMNNHYIKTEDEKYYLLYFNELTKILDKEGKISEQYLSNSIYRIKGWILKEKPNVDVSVLMKNNDSLLLLTQTDIKLKNNQKSMEKIAREFVRNQNFANNLSSDYVKIHADSMIYVK